MRASISRLDFLSSISMSHGKGHNIAIPDSCSWQLAKGFKTCILFQFSEKSEGVISSRGLVFATHVYELWVLSFP